ncbi:MAG: BamA/TamA family outer membrane protein [Candidatus Eisenbacteria bacterium]
MIEDVQGVRGRRRWAGAVVLALAVLVARAEAAGAQAAADTGWVEVGDQAPADSAGAAEGFGDDDPFADLPVEEETEAAAGGKILPSIDYNRVDQWVLGLELLHRPTAGMMPAMKLRVVRAFQRKNANGGDGRMLYDLRLDQPLVRGRSLRAGIARYRKTDDDRFGQVHALENAVATALFRWDFRDWFEREGFEAGLAGEWGPRWSATARWNADDYTSIPLLADGIAPAFRRQEPLRDNPAIDDGRIQAVTVGAAFDTRSTPAQPRSGMFHRVEVETAGGSLGGDYTYHRYRGDFRLYVSPSPAHLFKTRVLAGTAGHDDALPLQKTFAIGGVGTLRATPFRQFRGNRMFLWNADWAWEVLRRSSRNVAYKMGLSLVAFSDLGLAWDAPAWDAGQRRMAWNAGVGAGTTDENFRVYVGRDMRAEHAPLHVTVRVLRNY